MYHSHGQEAAHARVPRKPRMCVCVWLRQTSRSWSAPSPRAVAACLVQARRLGCAPLPLHRAVPALHPGLEAALQGNPWDSRFAEQHIAELDRAEAELGRSRSGDALG